MGDSTTITSRDILQALLAEIQETDPGLMPPPWPREKEEHSIGIITDEYLKRVFCLSSFYRREAQRTQVDLEAMGDEPKKNAGYNLVKQKHETLVEIFWLLLRHHMNSWGSNIGIRKNWEVVNTVKSDSGLPAVLRKLIEE
jgi:hypothetical protein